MNRPPLDPGRLLSAPMGQLRPVGPQSPGSSIATPLMLSRAAQAASSRADNDSFLRAFLAGLRG